MRAFQSVQHLALLLLFHFDSVRSSNDKAYLIGGFAQNGAAQFYKSFNSTFATYLTAAVQQNPNYASVTFSVVAVEYIDTYSLLEAGQLDFVYTQPSLFSCIEGEYTMASLATLRNLALGKQLAQFGGVIFVKKGSNITELDDLKGRRIAMVSFSGLGSGQMQWRAIGGYLQKTAST